jgi:hypothetical protein
LVFSFSDDRISLDGPMTIRPASNGSSPVLGIFSEPAPDVAGYKNARAFFFLPQFPLLCSHKAIQPQRPFHRPPPGRRVRIGARQYHGRTGLWTLWSCHRDRSGHDLLLRRCLADIIPNDQGNRTTPSYVAFTGSKCLIGEAAKNQAEMNPSNTIFGGYGLDESHFSKSTPSSQISPSF